MSAKHHPIGRCGGELIGGQAPELTRAQVSSTCATSPGRGRFGPSGHLISTPDVVRGSLSGRPESMSPMLKHFGWSATSAGGSGWRANQLCERVRSSVHPPSRIRERAVRNSAVKLAGIRLSRSRSTATASSSASGRTMRSSCETCMSRSPSTSRTSQPSQRGALQTRQRPATPRPGSNAVAQ